MAAAGVVGGGVGGRGARLPAAETFSERKSMRALCDARLQLVEQRGQRIALGTALPSRAMSA